LSTNGISYWKHGKDFVESCAMMIANNDRCNNEFYIAPVYNEFISNNKTLIPFYVNQMHGIGTPEDLNTYINRKVN
jgi:hypothetical protein